MEVLEFFSILTCRGAFPQNIYIIAYAHYKIAVAICWDASRQSVVRAKPVVWVYFAVAPSKKYLFFNATNFFF